MQPPHPSKPPRRFGVARRPRRASPPRLRAWRCSQPLRRAACMAACMAHAARATRAWRAPRRRAAAGARRPAVRPRAASRHLPRTRASSHRPARQRPDATVLRARGLRFGLVRPWAMARRGRSGSRARRRCGSTRRERRSAPRPRASMWRARDSRRGWAHAKRAAARACARTPRRPRPALPRAALRATRAARMCSRRPARRADGRRRRRRAPTLAPARRKRRSRARPRPRPPVTRRATPPRPAPRWALSF